MELVAKHSLNGVPIGGLYRRPTGGLVLLRIGNTRTLNRHKGRWRVSVYDVRTNLDAGVEYVAFVIKRKRGLSTWVTPLRDFLDHPASQLKIDGLSYRTLPAAAFKVQPGLQQENIEASVLIR